jgi:hypothetical protein
MYRLEEGIKGREGAGGEKKGRGKVRRERKRQREEEMGRGTDNRCVFHAVV